MVSEQAEIMLTTPTNPNNAVIFFIGSNIVYKTIPKQQKVFYYLCAHYDER